MLRLQPSSNRPSSPRKTQSQLSLTPTVKCSWLSGWTAKRQITASNIIPLKYSVADPVAPTSLREDENSSTPGLASPTSTLRRTSTSPESTCAVIPTLYPPCPDFAAPAFPPTSTPPSDVYFFGPGIEEALPYADLAQAPYFPPSAQEADDLALTDKSTTEAIFRSPSLLAFILSHPAAALLQ